MERLAEKHEDKAYTYAQIERHGEWAIFCPQHKESGVQRFELVRIRVQPPRSFPDGRVLPEREVYPGSTAWGREGWTFFSLADAQAALARKLAPVAVAAEEGSHA